MYIYQQLAIICEFVDGTSHIYVFCTFYILLLCFVPWAVLYGCSFNGDQQTITAALYLRNPLYEQLFYKRSVQRVCEA